MKIQKILFYGRTQVGLVTLLCLLAKKKEVVVIPKDSILENFAESFGLRTAKFEDILNENFDLFIYCHGKRIIPEEWLTEGKFINIHPCLLKYKGTNPIKRYMENKDTKAHIGSHYMIKEVDAGKKINIVDFDTPLINSYAEFYNLAVPYYVECIMNTLNKIELEEEIKIEDYHE